MQVNNKGYGHLCNGYDGTRVFKCCEAKQDESVTLMDGEIRWCYKEI